MTISDTDSQCVQRNDVRAEPRDVMFAFAATLRLRGRERTRWASGELFMSDGKHPIISIFNAAEAVLGK